MQNMTIALVQKTIYFRFTSFFAVVFLFEAQFLSIKVPLKSFNFRRFPLIVLSFIFLFRILVVLLVGIFPRVLSRKYTVSTFELLIPCNFRINFLHEGLLKNFSLADETSNDDQFFIHALLY